MQHVIIFDLLHLDCPFVMNPRALSTETFVVRLGRCHVPFCWLLFIVNPGIGMFIYGAASSAENHPLARCTLRWDLPMYIGINGNQHRVLSLAGACFYYLHNFITSPTELGLPLT